MPLLVFGKIHYAFFFAMILAYLAIQNKDAITWIKLKIFCALKEKCHEVAV
jgi:hypothetical protein